MWLVPLKMTLSQSDDHLEVFGIPTILLDINFEIITANTHFIKIFDCTQGLILKAFLMNLTLLNLKKISKGKQYSFKVNAKNNNRPFKIELTKKNEFIYGIAIDNFEVTKANQMLETYSDLVEKQNKKISSDNLKLKN